MDPDKHKNIIIVNYGMGNLQSVLYKFKRLNIDSSVSASEKDIYKADKLILPGVGHFSRAMKNLKELKLTEVLYEKVVINKTPVLGICLGMQLFSKFSEEGFTEGLGWIDAVVKRFKSDNPTKWKIPHIGWNTLCFKNTNPLFNNIDQTSSFYFAHSYYLDYNIKEDILTETNYIIDFPSSINKGNIYGTQFHPEKSHNAGLQIIKNFCQL